MLVGYRCYSKITLKTKKFKKKQEFIYIIYLYKIVFHKINFIILEYLKNN